MKLFELRRDEDESGISGTGTVAQGVIFDNGTCVLTWLTDYTSVAVYANIETVIKIHGHGGKTRVVQIADHDVEKLRAIKDTRVQDDCEGIVHGIRGTTADRLWDEREKLLRLLWEEDLGDE